MSVRFAVVAALMVGGSVGLAALASAEPAGGTTPLSGEYTATVTGTDGSVVVSGSSQKTRLFTSCGPGCTRMNFSPPDGKTVDMQLQGNVWTGTYATDIGPCTVTVDADSLVETDSVGNSAVHYQLSKNG